MEKYYEEVHGCHLRDIWSDDNRGGGGGDRLRVRITVILSSSDSDRVSHAFDPLLYSHMEKKKKKSCSERET